MAAKPVRVINIKDCHSDGDSSKWPTPDKGFKRNDEYFLQKVANDYYAKDLDSAELGGSSSSATWRLDRLPAGYAGFEKPRADAKHVDRYLHGHPRGQFRSVTEFYDHFKHLMDNGGPIGCTCKVCRGNKRNSTGGATISHIGARSVSPAQTSSYFPSATSKASAQKQAPPIPLFNQTGRPISTPLLPQGRLPDPSPPRALRKQADEDGSIDVFRILLDRLKATKDDIVIDEKISESTSPDWRVGNELLKELLDEWTASPQFVPRAGELVLFARDMKPEEALAWDNDCHTWQKVNPKTGTSLGRPKWEAGVVTQMPLQPVDERDLSGSAKDRSNVTNSGFRIEPLSKPGQGDKHYAKQYRYLPLHGIRPLVYWQDCTRGLSEVEWHESVKNALSVSNTFCVIGRNRFKGVRDELSGSQATIFCRGAYIGSELITVGDAVRLLPNLDEQKSDDVTDAIVVTAIKLRLVNIDEAGNDDWAEGRPYTTCLHISGKAFTLDRNRSYDGVGKVPIPSDSDLLPSGLEGYGQWYHMTDPQQTKKRLEVPFTRILGRVSESIALETWFQASTSSRSPRRDIQQFHKPTKTASFQRLKCGLSGLVEARAYAYAEDPRINKAAGKSWYWADTRVEALDIHEVNNRFVGAKDDTRTQKQMESWRKLLGALDGSKHGLAVYHAERVKREEESKKEKQELAAGSYGMVGAAVTMPDETSGTDGTPRQGDGYEDQDMEDGEEDKEMVDVDAEEDDDDDDDDDDDEDEPNFDGARAGAPVVNVDRVVELSD
jgi:hypothetical protein